MQNDRDYEYEQLQIKVKKLTAKNKKLRAEIRQLRSQLALVARMNRREHGR